MSGYDLIELHITGGPWESMDEAEDAAREIIAAIRAKFGGTRFSPYVADIRGADDSPSEPSP